MTDNPKWTDESEKAQAFLKGYFLGQGKDLDAVAKIEYFNVAMPNQLAVQNLEAVIAVYADLPPSVFPVLIRGINITLEEEIAKAENSAFNLLQQLRQARAEDAVSNIQKMHGENIVRIAESLEKLGKVRAALNRMRSNSN